MKGNIKKLAVFMMIAAIAMFTVVPMASADPPFLPALRGQYGATGGGTSLLAPLGFGSNLIPNGPPGAYVSQTCSVEGVYTPLLHKDAIYSILCSHKEAVPNLFTILSEGHPWIDPGDALISQPSLSGEGFNESSAEFYATTGYTFERDGTGSFEGLFHCTTLSYTRANPNPPPPTITYLPAQGLRLQHSYFTIPWLPMVR